MSRRIAFYAPLKAPDHPVPSGDRRMAQLLIRALESMGHDVRLASRLRSYDRGGDALRQARLEALAGNLRDRLLRRLQHPTERPDLWLTYHVYHKAPDHLGPGISRALGIPYAIIEASHAAKQATGPWARGFHAAERAIRAADAVVAMTTIDAAGLQDLVRPPAELHRLPPFVDLTPFEGVAEAKPALRGRLAGTYGLDPARPWLLAAAMMRADAKLESYCLLGEALSRLGDRDWQLLVVGDGPARAQVEQALAALAPWVVYAGALEHARLLETYAATDLLVWPAVREAYGLALLEAQAAGTPVVAGREGGVADVVIDGISGRLVPPREPKAFATAVRELLDDPDQLVVLGRSARRFVERERGETAAGERLDRVLQRAVLSHRRRQCD